MEICFKNRLLFFFIGVLCFFLGVTGKGRAVDPHSFFADPDQAVLLNADLEPGA